MKFSHLHNHTQFSLLDGASSIKKLYKKALADNMPAIAITDHGNMFGVFDFVKEAKKYKDDNGNLLIKPIVGCEFYLVEDRSIRQFTKERKDKRYHQLLLAKNKQGYKNIIKLCSLGYTEGLYGKYPRIDKELILQYHEGLIASTCCLGASVPKAIIEKGEAEAEEEFKWWLNVFGEDYYVEMQRHDIPEQKIVNEVLIKFAKKYNVKIIASNDSHYVDEEDSNAHDILLCVNTNEKQSTPIIKEFTDDDVTVKNKRFGFYNSEFYFKTTEQMTNLFSDIPEAIDNTNEIVDKVELISVTNDLLLPNFPLPTEFKSQDEYLEFLVYEGAKIKYKIFTPELEERIKFELGVIKKMGFAGYFLIVSDIITSSKKMGVIVGPGRGSAAGSVVAYCIDIITIDPLKYNLLFERFLNPERASMPDIDTDFDDIGRGKVVEYIVNKYGKNQVAHIITHGTMAAKSSIKDVARVLDLSLEQSNALAKLVPDKPGTSLNEILHIEEKELKNKEGISSDDIVNINKLQSIYKGNTLQSKILHEAEKLEGTVRNTGIHAAGIIIGPKDLMEIMPLCKQKDIDLYVTQFVGSVIEETGAIKIDVLGLSNLSIIRDAIAFIKQNHQIDLDIAKIPLNDPKTFELYQQGETEGTFQFASIGMKKYLKELKPDNIEDLIAMNALYRPGPLSYIPDFINRKNGKTPIVYDLSEMQEILKDTYGITVYQEQVMLLSQKLANFSKGDADILRKAMGKKQLEVLQKMKDKFMQGCEMNNHPIKTCEKIWEDWVEFAKYAFNKSHSTCYAYLAYQTAYLKANYPSEYMAALLNAQGNLEDISKYMKECSRMKIPVLGPDINESAKGFSVTKNGTIRFGLGAIKGVGEAAVQEIMIERNTNGDFKDVFDFAKRTNKRSVTKKTLENLIMAGALDSFYEMHRAQYFHVGTNEKTSNLEKLIRFAQMANSNNTELNNSLFGIAEMAEISLPKMTECEKWGVPETLNKEKELLGIFLSAHPLDYYSFELENYNITPLNLFSPETLLNKQVRIAGYIEQAQHLTSQKGTQYGTFKLVDYYGQYEFRVFTNDYLKFKSYIENDTKVMISGMFEERYNNIQFNIFNITLLDNVKKQYTKRINLKMNLKTLDNAFLSLISKYANTQEGCEMGIIINDDDSNEQLKISSSYRKIVLSDEFLEELGKFDNILYQIIST